MAMVKGIAVAAPGASYTQATPDATCTFEPNFVRIQNEDATFANDLFVSTDGATDGWHLPGGRGPLSMIQIRCKATKIWLRKGSGGAPVSHVAFSTET